MKRRYTIYLSKSLAARFNTIARVNGAKSALVELALDRQLDPDRFKAQDDALLRRMDGLSHGLSTIERDVAIATETLSLVRSLLSDHHAAGRHRRSRCGPRHRAAALRKIRCPSRPATGVGSAPRLLGTRIHRRQQSRSVGPAHRRRADQANARRCLAICNTRPSQRTSPSAITGGP